MLIRVKGTAPAGAERMMQGSEASALNGKGSKENLGRAATNLSSELKEQDELGLGRGL